MQMGFKLTQIMHLPEPFITGDGEVVVLDEAFRPDVRSLLRQKNIHLGKLLVFCSGIHQPPDVSPLFRAAKTRLRGLLSNKSSHSNRNPTI